MADTTQEQPTTEQSVNSVPQARQTEPQQEQQEAHQPEPQPQPQPQQPQQPQDSPDSPQPQPAAKKQQASPAKKNELEASKSPKNRSQSQSMHDDSKSRSTTSDPFVGLTAAERVKLGYELAKQKFAQKRVSASFASRTGRDPYRVLPPGGRKPPHIEKREEHEAARLEALRAELHYDPALRPPPSDFDPNRKEAKRASSWTRDATRRRPFAPRYDIIASSRGNETPGPGAYTSPLAFIGAAF